MNSEELKTTTHSTPAKRGKQNSGQSDQGGRSSHSRLVSRIGIMAATLIICSQISIPLPGSVPLSLQTFAIALLAGLLPPLQAFACVLTYLLLGAAGLPVFAGFQGGFARLIGPTGGFLFGFLPMAVLLSLAALLLQKNILQGGQSRLQDSGIGNPPLAARLLSLLGGGLLSLLGLACCHALGVLWLAAQAHMKLGAAAAVGSFPFILKDVISIIAAFLLACLIKRRYGKW